MESGKSGKDTLISVIIPVYNAEAYIDECIRSVTGQTYSNIEILVIDDGSADKSREICHGISREDKRIRVICQEHQGVSAARNLGVEKAEGKYLFFLDGDDVIHTKLLEALYGLAEMTGALVAAEYYCRKAGELYDTADKPEGEDTFSYRYLDSGKILQELPAYGKQGGIGGKLIFRAALRSLEFDVNLIAGEDTKLLYQLVAGGADAVILPLGWYYYRRHKGNSGEKYKVQVCRSVYKCMRYICDCEKECNRQKNAVHIEEYIIKCMMRWNKDNRKKHDKDMSEYLRKLVNIERKQELFVRINRHMKKNFYLMFYCYPVYWIQCRLSGVPALLRTVRGRFACSIFL